VVGIPAGVYTAPVVEFSAPRNRTPQELPAQSVGVAVLGLGHAAVGRCCSRELPAWRDGTIADAGWAVASPRVLSRDPDRARRVLELVGELPRPVWGRDELGAGEMWNSNSVIAWLLARAGLAVENIRTPAGPSGTRTRPVTRARLRLPEGPAWTPLPCRRRPVGRG
jgi:hypothetical protein